MPENKNQQACPEWKKAPHIPIFRLRSASPQDSKFLTALMIQETSCIFAISVCIFVEDLWQQHCEEIKGQLSESNRLS